MNWLCSCGDPTQLASVLHPSAYGSPGYLGISFGFFLVYALPLIVVSIISIFLLYLIEVWPLFHLSLILTAAFPPMVWVLFTYLDPAQKGTTNLLELGALGALVGACIGINGPVAATWKRGVILSYCLGLVAFALWMWVPAHPTNPWSYN